MMNRYTPQCKNCLYCKQIGRTNGKFSTNNTSRKTYYCEHPNVRNIQDKYGQPIYPFIGFGDTTFKSPLQLKTCKQWCPIIRLLDELDKAFTESVAIHLESGPSSPEWKSAHKRYCEAMDRLKMCCPDVADIWKPPTRKL